MSLTLGTSRTPRLEGTSVTTLWRAVVVGLKRIQRNAALRRELDRMDDHMLSDIGVSRAQIMFEVDRRP